MKLNSLYVFILTCLMFTSAWADVRPGAQPYAELDPAQPTRSEGKIEVVEIFWYGCPHCYTLEPHLEKWLETMPDDVVFRRVPGVLGKNWLPHARAYYTAELLGIVDKIHRPLFDAIHRDNRTIMNAKNLRDFFAEQGVSKSEFEKVYESEEVTGKIKAAFIESQGYKLTGVPAIIVNGKYRTGASMTGSNEKLIEVIDFLIAQERANSPR